MRSIETKGEGGKSELGQRNILSPVESDVVRKSFVDPVFCLFFSQVCPVSPSYHHAGVPSMWRVAQACQSAVCWHSGAERDTSWLAATKSTATSGMANHSGVTTCLSVKVSRISGDMKHLYVIRELFHLQTFRVKSMFRQLERRKFCCS